MLLMFVCGCAGSTSGGLKVGRIMILAKNLFNVFKKQTHPCAVIPVRVNGHVVSNEVVHKVLAFTFVYLSLLLFSGLVLTLDGAGFEEAIGAVFASFGKVGVGLGFIGSAGDFSEVADFSKWYLSFLMMRGRLGIFSVLKILLASFWSQ